MVGSAFIGNVKDVGKESKLICILESHPEGLFLTEELKNSL